MLYIFFPLIRSRVLHHHIEILMKVDFLLKLETIVFGNGCQRIKMDQVLVDVEDIARDLLLADSISQIEVVLEAKGPIAAPKVVLSKQNAIVLVANGKVSGTA